MRSEVFKKQERCCTYPAEIALFVCLKGKLDIVIRVLRTYPITAFVLTERKKMCPTQGRKDEITTNINMFPACGLLCL